MACENKDCCPVNVSTDRYGYTRAWRDYVGGDGWDAVEAFGAKGGRLDSDTAFFGIELELENAGGVTNSSYSEIKHVLSDKRFGIIKDDGSLDDGIEINSVPATLDEHYNFDWPNALKTIKRGGFAAQSSCGIHIHVSRKALKGDALLNMCRMVYSEDNFGFIRFISGRHSASWGKYKGLSIDEAVNGRYGKYVGLYAPRNGETVEFRLFASTLDEDRFLSRLEFVAALVEYCSDGRRNETSMNVHDFACWVSSCAPQKYRRLAERISEFDGLPEADQKIGVSSRGFRAA